MDFNHVVQNEIVEFVAQRVHFGIFKLDENFVRFFMNNVARFVQNVFLVDVHNVGQNEVVKRGAEVVHFGVLELDEHV